MPAFKRFGPEDQLDNVLILEPSYTLVSGAQGWSGSPEGSASLSLYGGARRRPGTFSTITYQSFAPNVNQTGNPRLGQPLTASVNFVYVTSEALGLSQVNSTRWGEEHWDVLQRLYQDYRVMDPDYVTSSYDNYCLFFKGTSRNVVVLTGALTPAFGYPSSSAQMAAAVGWGSWGFGWLLDEGTGSLTASFTPTGNPLPLQFDTSRNGTVNYGNPGPLMGTDLCVGFTSSSPNVRFDGGQNFDIQSGSDLLFAYVGRFRDSTQGGESGLNAGSALFGKVDPISNQVGWFLDDGGNNVATLRVMSTPTFKIASIARNLFLGEWHVAIGALDRSNGAISWGVRSMNTGRAIGSSVSFLTGNVAITSSQNFYVGHNPEVSGTRHFDLAALYMSTGSQVATGVIPNLKQALQNFSGYLGQYAPQSLTSSFTIESWFKPLAPTYAPRPFTLHSRNNLIWLGMTGSAGTVFFSGSNGIFVTSSLSADSGCWNHVAVTYDGTSYSGTLYLNLRGVGFTMTPLTASSPTTLHTVGNRLDTGTVTTGTVATESAAMTGTSGLAFHGFIGESRVWTRSMTYDQLLSVYNRRITGSDLLAPQLSLAFNDGPLSRVYSYPMGSGALDQARQAQGASFQFGRLLGFDDRSGPVWEPSDNALFTVPKRFAPTFVSGNSTIAPVALSSSDPVTRMLVLDVPSAFYGRQIAPGSVSITDQSWSDPSYGIVRTLVDDGHGGLYVSGSVASGGLPSAFDPNDSVGWPKVGNVFYGEGLVVIKDPALMDFGRTDGLAFDPNATLVCRFRGDSRVPVKTLMCRIDRGEFNCTNNPTFFATGSAGERLARHPSGSIRATTVGIYNSDRELVAVARLADPIRIRARDRINIRIRMDF